MDDQNQTNNPQPSAVPPMAPSMPEDITPQADPLNTAPQTAAPMMLETPPEPAPQTEPPMMPTEPALPPQPIAPVQEEPQPAPMVASTDTPVMPQFETMAPTQEPQVTAPTEAPAAEQQLPEVKKKKIAPAILGALALLLVAGVAGAAYYVSNQLSTRQAVAPNAPESKPMAMVGICLNPDGTFKDPYKKVDCGTQCCDGSKEKCTCMKGCVDKNDPNSYDCPDLPTCDSTRRDTPASNEITFAKAGTILPFMKNTFDGTITLSKTGSTDIVIPFKKGDAVALTSFKVNAGDKYTIKTKISTEKKNGYGWLANQGSKCGPVKTPGNPLTSNNKSTGKCGELVDISAVLKLATASATLTDITAGSVSGNVQCWGDALRNDSTQDYDYNDFTLVFGYQTTTTVGACSAINIYKKTGDTYSSTPLKVTELQNLAVGDKLMIYSRSSLANSGARFRVTVNGSAGEWVTGAIDGNDKTVHSYAYTISTAGTYVFEGQVTTTAQ